MGRVWTPDPRFSRTEGHTADLWIVGEGPDPQSVLSSMLDTLYSVISEEYVLGDCLPAVFVVEGASPEEALVRLLSEAIYLLEGEGRVLTDPRFLVDQTSEGTRIDVVAKSCLFSIPEGRSGIEVKAVTYHGAEMAFGTQGTCRARVLVDI